MADDTQGYATVLPNQFPSPGQALQGLIQAKERQQEKQAALDERQQEQKQKNAAAQEQRIRENEKYNLAALNKQTEAKQYETADEQVNNLTRKTLADIYNEGIKGTRLDPMDFEQMLKGKLGDLVQWNGNAKDQLKTIGTQRADFLKTLPNTDQTAVDKIVTPNFLQNVANLDENGNAISIKPLNQIKPNVNYFGAFSDPKVLASVTNDTTPLPEFFAKIPKQRASESDITSKAGNINASSYNTMVTPYSEMYTDETGKLAVRPQSQIAMVTEKDGEPIRVASEELKNAMQGNPKVEAAFNKEWQNYVQQHQLEAATNQDPHALDVLKENYRYKLAEQYLPHQVNTIEKQVTPTIVNKFSVENKHKEDVIDDNAGTLKSHLENAFTNNPVTFRLPIKGGGTGTQTWGNLGHSDITTPFTIKVEEKEEDKQTKTKVVSFDDYFVSPDNKIYGVYYKRTPTGEITDDVKQKQEIPIERYAERLLEKSTPQKYRKAVIKNNVDEVIGITEKPKTKKENTTAETSTITVVMPDGRQGEIPKSALSQFLKDNPKAKTIK